MSHHVGRPKWQSVIFTILVIGIVIVLGNFITVARRNRNTVHQSTFYSASLNKQMHVSIFLPPGYSPRNKYPVLYLLHGKDGNEESWMSGHLGFQGIHIDETATYLILHKKIQPLIIVSPEINNSYGINTSQFTQSVHGYNRGMYEDYIVKDLVVFVDSHYSTIQNRNGRYIGGFSMGGFAALHDAFLHPDLFSKVGVMSAALWDGGLPDELSWIYSTHALQQSRDPIMLAENHNVKNISITIIEGTSDPFLQGNKRLATVLEHQGALVTYHPYAGAHTYTFWQKHSDELLLFFNYGKR